MIGKIVVLIHPKADDVGLRMHVRHEAADGLWDSRELDIGGDSYERALDHLLVRVELEVRSVLQMTEDRTAA